MLDYCYGFNYQIITCSNYYTYRKHYNSGTDTLKMLTGKLYVLN